MSMSVALLLIFAVLILLGVPIAVSLGVASAVTLVLYTEIPINLMAQSMFSSMNSFIMVAVPLFILAGVLMDEGGVGEKIYDFANAVVGWMPGGLGQVNVVGSLVFAGMSGSNVADIASVGAIEISQMSQNGYPKEYAASLTLLTSVLASIIPPSILMVVAGSTANESIGKLMVAGLIPGVLIAIAFMIYNHFHCVKHGYGIRVPFSLRNCVQKVLVAIPALVVPVLLLYGIVGGFFTPTEAAGVAVAYCLVISLLVYRQIDWRKLPYYFFKTAKMTGTILFVAVTAKVAGWIFEFDGLPARVATFLTQVTDSPAVVMLLISLFLIVVGMFMDATASLFLLIPILLPPVKAVGIDPIHFLVCMVLMLSLGLVTPPVGVCLFAVSNVSGLSLERIVRASLPLMVVLFAVILVLCLVPSIILTPLSWFGM